ncbi:MAG: hypothetical protein ABH828_06370 [archaeon]
MGEVKKTISDLLRDASIELTLNDDKVLHNSIALDYTFNAFKDYSEAVFGVNNIAEKIHLFSETYENKFNNLMNNSFSSFKVSVSFLLNYSRMGEIPENGVSMVEDYHSFEYLIQVLHNVNTQKHTLKNHAGTPDYMRIINTSAYLMYEIVEKCIDLERL